MNILDEGALRAALLGEGVSQYRVEPGTFVTPLAMEYLRDRGIELVFGGDVMPYTPIEDRGERTYVDAQNGDGFRDKPERMTHLYGNKLVPKSHPRITLRGKLDTLQGEIIMAQVEAKAENKGMLASDLGEMLALARELLGAEVAGRAMPPTFLFGYDSDDLRRVSHHVKEHFGFDHPIPSHEMGHLAASLNMLRTHVREVEIAAEMAFAEGERGDILMALNRMSSAAYILLCRLLAGQYRGG